MIRDILKAPHPTLRQEAEPIEEVDDEIRDLIDDLVETMRNANGLGLAAPQVGVSKRISVIEFTEPKEDDKSFKLTKLINPEIVDHAKEKVTDEEGCLSIPGTYGDVERYEWVKVKVLTEDNEEKTFRAEGLKARVIQHEIDHMDGVLFIDEALDVRDTEFEGDYPMK